MRIGEVLKISPIDVKDRKIIFNATRVMVKKAGKMLGVNLGPQDLRCHTATHRSKIFWDH